MKEPKKILGEERRNLLLYMLKDSKQPITGSELAARTNVSRQVIVGDITLLKAKGEPIIATSQGYVYFTQPPLSPIFERTIVCQHTPEQTENELTILVDHGVTVKDVKVEHGVYGDLTALVMVSNRKEVKQFLERIQSSKATYLSVLTGGIHTHTITAPSTKNLDEAEKALREANILVED